MKKYASTYFDLNVFNKAYREFRNANTEEAARKAFSDACYFIAMVNPDELSLRQTDIFFEMKEKLQKMEQFLKTGSSEICRRYRCPKYQRIDTSTQLSSLYSIDGAIKELKQLQEEWGIPEDVVKPLTNRIGQHLIEVFKFLYSNDLFISKQTSEETK